MINKNRFGVANDKKLLRKIGKQWVTVSALTLVLLGGGAVASSVVTHAATNSPAVETQDTNSIKEKINNNLDKAYQNAQSANGSSVSSSSNNSASASSVNKPSNIQSQATNMYRGLMLNAVNNSNSTATSSASSKSSASGSVSSSSKPSFNSAYQSYMAKMSGTDSEVTKDNDKNTQNNNSNNNQNKPVIKHNLGDTNYFTGATHTGTDDGLNYTAYANGGVEVTGGTANTNLSKFSNNPDVKKATAIKFDDDINTTNVSDMFSMFGEDTNLQSLYLGSGFDTRRATNSDLFFFMGTSLMFANDNSLTHIHISSPNTIINPNTSDDLPEPWYNVDNPNVVAKLDDGKSHVGDWIQSTDTINFTGANTSSTTVSGKPNSNGTVTAPDGYYFTDNGTNTEPIVFNGKTYTFNVGTHYDWLYFPGDSDANTKVQGTLGDTDTISAPSGYHFTDGKDKETFTYDDGQHTYNVNTNHMSDTVHFQNVDSSSNGLTVPSDKSESGDWHDKYTITVPQGWGILNSNLNENNKSFTIGEGNQTVDIAPIHTYKGLQYIYDKASNSVEFVGGTANSDMSNFTNEEVYGEYSDGGGNFSLGYKDFTPSDITNAAAIKFNNDVDISHVTNMKSMFGGDSNLQSLDLGDNFDTSNVTNMSNMLSGDSNLQSLNFGNHFNTSKVTNMSNMFGNIGLQSLTLPDSFDTSNVTNMSNMFRGADLQSINFGSHFDTSKVTSMNHMFSNSPLQSLTLPDNFNTANVSDMNSMFQSDYNLQSLNLGKGFNTNKQNNGNGHMSDMLQSDKSLSEINIGNPDTKFSQNVTYNNEFYRDMGIPNGINTKYINTNNHIVLGQNNAYPTADLSDGNSHVGDWFTPTSTSFVESDIYGGYKDGGFGNDDLEPPYTVNDALGEHYTVSGPKGRTFTLYPPKGWAFVNSDGSLVNGTNNVDNDGLQFKYGENANTITLKVAPVTDGLTFKYDDNNYNGGQMIHRGTQSLEFTGGTATSDLSDLLNVTNAYGTKNYLQNANSIKFDDNVDTSHVTNMSNMLNIPWSNFTKVDFGKSFDTSHVTNMKNMFNNTNSLQKVIIRSPKTRFNNDSGLDSNNNNYGGRSADSSNYWQNPGNNTLVTLKDNKSHVGTWVPAAIVTDSIFFNEDSAANTKSTGLVHSTGHIAAPKGYHFIDVFKNNATMSSPQPFTYNGNDYHYFDVAPNLVTDTIDYQVNGVTQTSHQFTGNDVNAQGASDTSFTVGNKPAGLPANYQVVNPKQSFNYDGGKYPVAIKPNTETDKINYIDNGKAISSPTKAISGNYNSDAQSDIDSHVPSNYHAVSGDTGTFTPNGTFNVQIAPNQVTEKINFVNGNGDTTTVTPTGTFGTPVHINAPAGYHIDTNNKPLIYDNQPHTIHVTPNQVTDTIDYQLNDVTKGSHQFTGNDYQATGANNTSVDINNSNDAGMPAGYRLMNKDNVFNYDGGTHDVAIEPVPNIFNIVEYIDNDGNGSDVGDAPVYGQENTDVPDKAIKNDVPKGYRLSQSLPVEFTDNPNDPIIRIAVQSDGHKSDMVVGTAFLTLLYKKGPRTDGQVLRLHINGNIGDSPIIINPQDYDRDGYSVASSDNVWKIPFDYKDVKAATNDFSRYNVENTFTYQAQPISINIDYVDTQTGNPVPNTSTQKLSDVAYDGDTIDLQDANSSNGLISVDGNNYRLNLPAGYHLAHGNNYILVNQNATKPVSMVNLLTGRHELRMMPLMKLTLGITPHFNKPTSNSSFTPVKPSSASSVTPKSASSASTESSSALVIPSSASQSQSAAPNSVASSSMAIPSSAASVTPVTPSVASSSVTSTKASSSATSANVSVKPSSISTNKTIARSVIRHVSHKHATKKRVRKPIAKKHAIKPTAKHDTQRLNHQVTQDKHKLNIVERHMKARKSIIRKATYAKKTIKHAKKRLHYLRRNKRHVAHALRRITRNKVAIKCAKRVVRTAKQARPSFVHAKATPVEPTTDKFTAPSVKAPVATPHAKSTAVHTNRKKLPQTSEATDHAGIVAIILMIMSVILAGFDKAFGREHNE